MRTTISLDDDVAAAIERVRREKGTGLSETINNLVRAGLVAKKPRARFESRSSPIGLRIDVTNVQDAIEELEGPFYK